MSVLDSIPHGIADGESDRRTGVRWPLLVAAVLVVPLIGYLGTAGLVALVMGTAEGGRFSVVAVLLAAVPGWLAAHQVPLSITGSPLSVLPLVPTLLVVVLTAFAANQVARRSRLRRPTQARWVIVVMGGAQAVLGLGVSLVLDDVVGAEPVDAFLCCGLTATLASAAGVANRCGLVYLVWERVDAEIWFGLRAGLLGLAAAVGAGALVLLVALGLSAGELLATLDRPGEAFGLTLLSLFYLPNAVAAGWSFASGTGLSIGGYSAGPLHFTAGSLPEVPLLAALPVDGPALWWPVALLLPPAIGGLVGMTCRRAQVGRVRRLVVVGVAAGTTAVGVMLLAAMAGGRLGSGAFDPVTLNPGLLAVLTFGWIALPAGLVTWFTEADEEPEPEDDEVDEEADEGEAEDQDKEVPEIEAEADDEQEESEDPDEGEADEAPR